MEPCCKPAQFSTGQTIPKMNHTEHTTALTIPEAAKALGVCERTIHNLTRTRALASVKFGRCVRISPQAIAAFLAKHTRNAAQ